MVLLVAFKGKYNMSEQLVSLFDADKLLLTNSFKGIDFDLKILDHRKYSLIMMFGIDKNLKNQVRIEKYARIHEVNKETSFNIENINRLFIKYQLNSFISNQPTKYLCNYAYYQMLEKTENKAIFIHIPGLKNMTDEFMIQIKKALDEWIKEVTRC